MKLFSKFQSAEAPKVKADKKSEEKIEVESQPRSPEKGREESIKIENIEDFIHALQWSYDLEEDSNVRKKIAHQIVKIEMSLNRVGLSAEAVKVEDTPDGVLGLYYPGSGHIAASKELLEDFNASSALITHVLCHESIHKEGIHDEGLTELATNAKLPPMIKFYVSEQKRAKSVFHNLGRDKALSLYDIDKPQNLINEYLEVEIEKSMKGKMLEREKMHEDAKYLDKKVKKEEEKYRAILHEGIPTLSARLNSSDMRKTIKKILERLRDEY